MGNISMEVASGTYQFKVEYSKIKGIPKGGFISSPIFIVNGHDCKILYFPHGYDDNGTMRLTFAMNCKSGDMTASLALGLLNKYGRLSSNACRRVNMATFRQNVWHEHRVHWKMKQSELESHFVRDGCFTLICSVTFMSESYKEVPKRYVNGILPFNIDDYLFHLLERKEAADVSFEVDGEIFTAHRSVLAARSQVFNAQLLGPMAGRGMEPIKIEDVKPMIFKAMLHFIYTDSLPDMSDENVQLVAMTQHLLVAADKYALDGLKILCEDRLLRDISMDTVISIVTLAEQLELDDLLDECLNFICNPTTLSLLATTDDYVQLMQRCPSLRELIGHHIRSKIWRTA
ncbi:hypothetical protein LUZ63_011165 [Rhynchospora breviuscula]|uniref:BTB domain-containing protein n=1 Tax=Rhynchospora breviuscula TaxID=2022672 RepID=A0A9Q0HQA1_9POAL|nr:hypothetical protein LUZ63_011165 [Rhynchospora breviuscula]